MVASPVVLPGRIATADPAASADCVCVKAASGNPSAPAPVVAAAVLMKFLRVISLSIMFSDFVFGEGVPDCRKIDKIMFQEFR